MSCTAKAILLRNLCGLSGILASNLDTIYGLVFNDSLQNAQLKPEETLDYLVKLKSLKQDEDPYVSSFIELSQNHPEKCDLVNTRRFEFLLTNCPPESKALRSYREYHWSKRVATCKDVWKNDLEDDVNNLTETDKQRIQELKESIIKTVSQPNYKLRFVDVDTRELTSGILAYFENNLTNGVDKLLSGRKHNELFEEEYSKLLKSLCSSMRLNLKRSIELYKLFIYKDVNNQVDDDDFVHNWLENIEVCKIIESRQKPIMKDLYKLLKEKHSKRGCLFGNCH